ncbi:MAG: hypothetical protein JW783_10560 [Bacteroidales bacterium]|nr:hypothetical protein [Bacteroidales bacterium]MBN2749776.1 hypothetical protein [Bacteroidales bacterium]
MKRNLLILVLVCISSLGIAQLKVVDKSGKTPKWINGIEKDYIIVSGGGLTLDEAQNSALSMIKERIVNSVAENVSSRSEMRTEEANYNNNVSVFLEKFASTTTAQSGKVPFLQGISLSKVEDYYWEKVENKADRSVRFNYHIKYPFPEFELKKLVSDFKMRDAELTRQLEDLAAQVNTVESVEAIAKNIDELKILTEYFMDGRKDQAELTITRYRALYESIELVEQESGLGELKYSLRLGERTISTVRKPTLKSECARILSTINSTDHWVVKYDFENCYDDPENNILVSYRFGNSSVKKNFYFDISENKARIYVSDPFRLTSIETDGEHVSSAMLDITLVSKYAAPFTVEKVELEWTGVAPVVIEDIGQSFSGKGNHSLKLEVTKPLGVKATTTKGKSVTFVYGYIYYRNDSTGEAKTYRIYNHSYTTDW